jgi:hypothetical protein
MKPDTIVVRDVIQYFILGIITGYKSRGGQPFRFQGTKKRSVGALSQQLPFRLMDTLFEKMPILQALTDTDYKKQIADGHIQLNLFET